MTRLFLFLITFVPVSAVAEAYDRPIPQAQSATAEFWFLLASLMLLVALGAVGWLVKAR